MSADPLKALALRHLARREHSRAELAKKLSAHGEAAEVEAVLDRMQELGKAQLGDKTMLDVLIPIHECFTAPYADGSTLYECLADANQAANGGVEYTKTIAARKGRASYLGERSIGCEDPGAVSSMLMFRAAYQFLNR